jgi:biopolymer transport protein ExbD
VSAQSSSLLGYGLYFIDVLACLLFCVTLALVGARFGQESTVELALPEIEPSASTGSDLTGTTVTLRTNGAALELTLDGEIVDWDELAARLERTPMPSLIVRSEASSLTRVIAIAHTAGVHDIQLAYANAQSTGSGERETQ